MTVMRKRNNNEKASREYITENVILDEKTGCWNWKRSVMSNGYGAAWNGIIVTGAHRVSYELWIAPVPPGAFVLHRCDNRKCCNPSHLFLGTAKTNTEDMLCKGRNRFIRWGSLESPNAKLNREQVVEIRNSSETHRQIAERYCISKTAAGNVKSGRTYAEVV